MTKKDLEQNIEIEFCKNIQGKRVALGINDKQVSDFVNKHAECVVTARKIIDVPDALDSSFEDDRDLSLSDFGFNG